MTIYERIGGHEVVKTAVSVFYGRVTEDETLARWFAGVDLGRLKAHQRAFLAAALDGPDLFTGVSLTEAHGGLDVTDEAFSTIVEHLITTLDDLGIDEATRTEVAARLEALRSQVVGA